MEKIWLKSYPAGVPAEIRPEEYASLREMYEEACRDHGDAPAFTSMQVDLSFREFDAKSRDFGAWLQRVARLSKGDRVALMMPNILQYPIALYGVLRAGFVIVNTNPLYTARELEHQLKDSGAKAIVVLENFAQVLAEVIGQTDIQRVIVTSVGEMLGFPKSAIVDFLLRHIRRQVPRWHIAGTVKFRDALAAGAPLPLDPVPLAHEDIAFLQYTGGTTGVAKAAMLTHRNMIANVLQASAWVAPVLGDSRKRVVITALPLYHIFSLTANCMLFTRLGARNVLIANPRDFKSFVAELARHPFHFISGVNTLFNALLHFPGFDRLDFSALKISLGGGMAVQRIVAEKWEKVTGCRLTQAWGLTETSPAVCINPLDIAFNGSIGLPIPSTEVSIRDDAGEALDIGEVGELCVRGPQVMAGYWNRPDETAKVMVGDWLRTGDIGRMDAKGFVYIEDRKKDMILVSGFNVYPNEVENIAATHPGVLEVAAVSQPDERSGEVVALFVVKNDPALTAEALIDFCRTELTGYKVPKHVYFRGELPKTNVGKILRRALRDELLATMK